MASGRFSQLCLALVACATMLVTTGAYATSIDQTGITTDPGCGNIIVVAHVDYDGAFDIAPLPALKAAPQAMLDKAYRLPRPATMTPRPAASTVLATTLAGWRSGRLRRLSAG